MIFKDIWLDIKAVQERDPAARNALEVLLLYQGVHALIWPVSYTHLTLPTT